MPEFNQELSHKHPQIIKKNKTKHNVYIFKQNTKLRVITTDIIKILAEIGEDENKITRLCLQKNDDDLLHSMLIYLPQNACYAMHMHPDKNESYQHIKGDLEIQIKQQKETPVDTVLLNQICPVYYSPKGVWHSLKAVGDSAIYIENREGPLMPDHTVWLDGQA